MISKAPELLSAVLRRKQGHFLEEHMIQGGR